MFAQVAEECRRLLHQFAAGFLREPLPGLIERLAEPHARLGVADFVAALRERVALADQVQTGQRSQLQVLLLDRAVFTVGANARLTIDRYVYDPATGRAFSATVAKGAFRFMSGRRGDGSNSSIRTPVATIGIRGGVATVSHDGRAGTKAQKSRAMVRGGGRKPRQQRRCRNRRPGGKDAPTAQVFHLDWASALKRFFHR